MFETPWDEDRPVPQHLEVQGVIYRVGDRILLHPRRKADIFDLALDGKTARIVSIEEDHEGQCYFTVAVDDDPGQDFGLDGKPGHRFFFAPDEVSLLEEREQP